MAKWSFSLPGIWLFGGICISMGLVFDSVVIDTHVYPMLGHILLMIRINIMEINRIRSCSEIHYKDFAIIEIDVRYDNDALQRERMWELQAKLLLIAMEVLVLPSGADAAIIFATLSHLKPMGWINLLYYSRGISEVTWIVVYVPLCLIRGMAEFLQILLPLCLHVRSSFGPWSCQISLEGLKTPC